MQHRRINLRLPISATVNDCKITPSFLPGAADQWIEVAIVIVCTPDEGEQIPRLIMECMDSVKHINRYFLSIVTRIPKFASDHHDPWPCVRVNLGIKGHFVHKARALFLKRKITWKNHDVYKEKAVVCCGLPQWPIWRGEFLGLLWLTTVTWTNRRWGRSKHSSQLTRK